MSLASTAGIPGLIVPIDDRGRRLHVAEVVACMGRYGRPPMPRWRGMLSLDELATLARQDAPAGDWAADLCAYAEAVARAEQEAESRALVLLGAYAHAHRCAMVDEEAAIRRALAVSWGLREAPPLELREHARLARRLARDPSALPSGVRAHTWRVAPGATATRRGRGL